MDRISNYYCISVDNAHAMPAELTACGSHFRIPTIKAELVRDYQNHGD